MALISICSTRITVPERRSVHLRIGRNHVTQLSHVQECLDVEVFDHGRRSYLLRTEAKGDFVLSLRGCRVEHAPSDRILRPQTPLSSVEDLDEATALRWVQHPLDGDGLSPSEVLRSWRGAFRFRQADPATDAVGLRKAQIGAIHAAAAYMSVRTRDPATIVMPTGTGKTESMLGTLVLCRPETLLLIVPSRVLRQQLWRKFYTLGCLQEIGALHPSAAYPRVALLKHGLQDEAACRELFSQSNVIIATPDTLRHFSDAARDYLTANCTHLFIDEAHHVGAPTWKGIRDAFASKKILQFTATPFRRDGKNLEGRVVFNYSLGEAQEDGYFCHIRLNTVEEYDDDESDVAIAEAAIGILREDLAEGHNHRLLARANSVDRAIEVFARYESLAADLNPVLVHNRRSASQNGESFDALASGLSRIVVCVDMLGEGFDMPSLKVAAIHDVHKSLAVTMQFIGRFTRVDRNVDDAAAVVNIAEPKVRDELQALYAEDADWDRLLRQSSETRIGREIALLGLVESFRDHGDLGQHLSLWNLRPSTSAIFYRTNCTDWSPRDFGQVLSNDTQRWHALSQSERVLVVVAARTEKVKWGKYKELRDHTYELMVTHWDEERQALFISCSDYDYFRCQTLAEALCGADVVPIVGDKVFRVFGGVERAMVRNLGASKAGNISFTMYFGPNVTVGLTDVDKGDANLSNVTGWGYENGERVTWGCSQRKGKIWSISGGPITDWRDWCLRAHDKLDDESLPEADIIAGFLRPELLTARHDSCPISIQWGEKLISEPEDRVLVYFGDTPTPLHEVDIYIMEFSETSPIQFSVSTEGVASIYELTIGGEQPGYGYVHRDGPSIFIQRGRGHKRSFEDYMRDDPVVILYVDGSFSYNSYLVRVSSEIGLFDPASLEPLDWTGTNVRKESQGKERATDSIQYKVAQDLLGDYDVLMDDDGSGEAADLVGIRVDGDGAVRLCLVHCKYSSEDAPGGRVKDMYAVCGQAQKSIRWKHAGFGYLVNHLKQREAVWKPTGASRLIKGELRDLYRLKKSARRAPLKLEIVIVQPGLSAAAVSDNIRALLGGTELYVSKTAQAEFRVMCSA